MSVLVPKKRELELFEAPISERGLRATKPFEKYEEIALAASELMVVRNECCTSHCQTCFGKIVENPVVCAGCAKAFFCSGVCREKGFRDFHQYECKLWAAEPEYPHYSLIQHSRALLLAKNDCSFKEILDALVSYETDDFDVESKQGLAYWIVAMKQLAPEMIPEGWADAQIRRAYFSIKLNAFNVNPLEPGPSYASGLFSRLCLFNHSCAPNCAIVCLPDHRIRIISLRPISAGEELTIEYTSGWTRKSIRRQKLKKNFFFDCLCDLCDKESDIDWDESADSMERFKSLAEKYPKDHSAVVDSANILYEETMKSLTGGQISPDLAKSLVSTFLTPEGELQYILSNSMQTMWLRYVVLTSCAATVGLDEQKRGAAQKGLELLQAAYPEPYPALIPYVQFLLNALS